MAAAACLWKAAPPKSQYEKRASSEWQDKEAAVKAEDEHQPVQYDGYEAAETSIPIAFRTKKAQTKQEEAPWQAPAAPEEAV